MERDIIFGRAAPKDGLLKATDRLYSSHGLRRYIAKGMLFLAERRFDKSLRTAQPNMGRQERIDREVQSEAGYVVREVRKQIEAGQQSPYEAYARVNGLSPEDTARHVGQAVINQLGGEFRLDAALAETESELVVQGAIIRVFQAGDISIAS